MAPLLHRAAIMSNSSPFALVPPWHTAEKSYATDITGHDLLKTTKNYLAKLHA